MAPTRVLSDLTRGAPVSPWHLVSSLVHSLSSPAPQSGTIMVLRETKDWDRDPTTDDILHPTSSTSPVTELSWVGRQRALYLLRAVLTSLTKARLSLAVVELGEKEGWTNILETPTTCTAILVIILLSNLDKNAASISYYMRKIMKIIYIR